jgi:alginate O-acetyltransferase complex protein AlgI
MVFVSNTFLFFFLPIFLLLYFLLPGRLQNLWIVLASWIFYAWWKPEYLLLLVFICVWSWATGLWIARSEQSRAVLLIAILGPLSALLYFKYFNLIMETASYWSVLNRAWSPVELPIGLSFFVFGAISYSVDVYRRAIPNEKSLIDYSAYQSTFGHLVAGPIVRYRSIRTRLKHRTFQAKEFELGVERFMLGFVMKVLIADTLAPLVDAGFSLQAPSFADVFIATTAYTLQIYFDFAGYSHMAIGLGLMVGLRFPENFNLPYLSTSLAEFWRRWHISLSSWLRDYLYIPLGGNREGQVRTLFNILVTMALGGLWHGASWTFLLWGIWHGLGLVFVRMWQRLSPLRLPLLLAQPLTLLFVMLGWILFRANNWETVETMCRGLSGGNGFQLSSALLTQLRPIESATVVLGYVLIYASALVNRPHGKGIQCFRMVVLAIAWLLAVIVLQGRAVVPFLYFQF